MPLETLFLRPYEISTELPPALGRVEFSTGEKSLLLRAFVDSYSENETIAESATNYTIAYSLDPDNTRIQQFEAISKGELEELINNYRKDPYPALRVMRHNLINIVRDERLNVHIKNARLERYFKAYLELMIKLDSKAYPPMVGQEALEGLVPYLPDGYSDLGMSKETDENKRGWEKIRVSKKEFYEAVYSHLLNAIWPLRDTTDGPDSKEVALDLARHIMDNSFLTLRAGYTLVPTILKGKSVIISAFRGDVHPQAVCRHISIDIQLCMQALGLNSRHVKCYMDSEAHAANLVEAESQWYLLDGTNPEVDPVASTPQKVVRRPYIRPISLNEMPMQTWPLMRYDINKKGQLGQYVCNYTFRNNNFYRILDNTKNPAVAKF